MKTFHCFEKDINVSLPFLSLIMARRSKLRLLCDIRHLFICIHDFSCFVIISFSCF